MSNGKHTRGAVRRIKTDGPWKSAGKEYFCGAKIELYERDGALKTEITRGTKTVFSTDCGETWQDSPFPSW